MESECNLAIEKRNLVSTQMARFGNCVEREREPNLAIDMVT